MRLTLAGLAFAAALGLGPGSAGADGDRTPSPRPGEDPAYTQAVRAIDAGQYRAAIPLLEGVVTRDPRNADAYNWPARDRRPCARRTRESCRRPRCADRA